MMGTRLALCAHEKGHRKTEKETVGPRLSNLHVDYQQQQLHSPINYTGALINVHVHSLLATTRQVSKQRNLHSLRQPKHWANNSRTTARNNNDNNFPNLHTQTHLFFPPALETIQCDPELRTRIDTNTSV